MRVDDPALLDIGDRVQRQRNGPIWTVKATRRSDRGDCEVGVWNRNRGWRVFPFAGLILVERLSDRTALSVAPSSAKTGSTR